jgi:hypothetical protein
MKIWKANLRSGNTCEANGSGGSLLAANPLKLERLPKTIAETCDETLQASLMTFRRDAEGHMSIRTVSGE